MYSELLKLFDVREVANLVHDALGSLPTVMHGDESLQAVKLQSIGKTVESHLYTNPGKATLGCLQMRSSDCALYLGQQVLKGIVFNFSKQAEALTICLVIEINHLLKVIFKIY